MTYLRIWTHAVALAMFVAFAPALLGGCATSTKHATEATANAPSVDMPHAVPFVGVQAVFGRNALGDAIVITAVHGTADTMAIGNTYRVDGAYTLASHDEATLSAYSTDTQPNLPQNQRIPGQSTTIHKGSGTFTVYLKVEDPGCPHVSFYPTGRGGESFAGEYFGTGEFLPPQSWRAGSSLAAR